MHLLSTLRVLNYYRSSATRVSLKLNCQRLFFKRGFMPKPKSENESAKLHSKLKNEGAQEEHTLSSLLKCYLFTGGFCGAMYVATSVWHYESNVNFNLSQRFSETWTNRTHKAGQFRQQFNIWWNKMPEGQKVFWYIFSLNLLVFCCWKVPTLNGFMMRYFTCSPIAKAICWPMLFSTFSHISFLHFGMNMFVLDSFCARCCDVLGKEQFIGFYLCSGVLASLASQTFKFIIKAPNPSVGASGAILALIGFFCCVYPKSEVRIIFLPNYPIHAENAIIGILCLDIVGILFRWRLFDNAAHLGGALFGIFYCHFGDSLIWCHKNLVIQRWKYIKNKLKMD